MSTTMLERELNANVVDLAHLFGWTVAYFRPAQTDKGWRTPVGADGKGWPDLVLCRERIVFAELKTGYGKLTDEQNEWGARLLLAGAEYHVWRPVHWHNGEIESVLKKRAIGADRA